MRRLLVCLVAAATLPGCSGSGGSRLFDPFSPTTIEPPRTGWINGQPANDPYYSETGQASLSDTDRQGSGWRPNANTTALEPAPRYQPSASDHLSAGTETRAPAASGDRIAIPVAARESSRAPAATSSAVAAGVPRGSPLALPPPPPTDRHEPPRQPSRDRVVGTIQPGPRGSGRSTDGRFSPPTVSRADPEPRRLKGSGSAVDIMDLPPAGSSRSSRSSTHSGGIRLVSGIEEIDEPAGDTAIESGTSPSTRGPSRNSSRAARYAHDADYRRLRGRLEYSETAGRWKLRYIPVDGKTDAFGGSVVLASSSALSGYERGQFVEVQGRLVSASPGDDRGYAPEFEIARIERLGR